MKAVTSKMDSTTFTSFDKHGVQRKVLVPGGVGIAAGVRTEVSDADAEFLSSHKMFKDIRHAAS